QTCVCPAAAYIICGMPTALWTGSLSFGLVVIPVRLYPAVRKKTVRFHEIDRGGHRIRHVRVADPEPELDYEPRQAAAPSFQWTPSQAPDLPPAAEVPYEEIRTGFEIAPGQFESLSREEVQAPAPPPRCDPALWRGGDAADNDGARRRGAAGGVLDAGVRRAAIGEGVEDGAHAHRRARRAVRAPALHRRASRARAESNRAEETD